MSNMQSNACIGKTHAEIWELYRDAHSNDPITEAELLAIHKKWKRIGSQVAKNSTRKK
jgi:hypothetical protein